MSKNLIVANWKMNKTQAQVLDFIDKLSACRLKDFVEVVCCPPSIYLNMLSRNCSQKIKFGAQNMHWAQTGAYTGEISPEMLRDLEVDYVLVGHSERRQYFGETNETVNKKVLGAFRAYLKPILCIGESLEARLNGDTEKIITQQINSAIQNLTIENFKDLICAYEPIWAIGTGKASSAYDANEVALMIRDIISRKTSQSLADSIKILYGGSVTSDNIFKYTKEPNINGALVGSASLDPYDFSELINNS